MTSSPHVSELGADHPESSQANDKMTHKMLHAETADCPAACSSNSPRLQHSCRGHKCRNRQKLGSISMEILSVSRAGLNWCNMTHILVSFDSFKYSNSIQSCAAAVHLVMFIAWEMESIDFESWKKNCQAQVQSQIQVPNPSPKSGSQILNPKSRGKGLGLGLTL